MGLFKRKKEKKVVEETVDVEAIHKQIIELESNTSVVENREVELAKLYSMVDNTLKSIEILESLMDKQPQLGTPYNDLMSYYNKMRKQAAINKDGEMIQFYLDKIDSLMQFSKDTLRGKNKNV